MQIPSAEGDIHQGLPYHQDYEEVTEVQLAWITSAVDEESVGLFKIGLDAHAAGACTVTVVLIASNLSETHSRSIADLADTAGIPISVVDPRPFRMTKSESWRDDFEAVLTGELSRHKVDLAMLAGYMLIAGPRLLSSIRMVNLHPALPGGPTGTRAQVVRELVASKADATGLMLHWVTSDLDRGDPVFTATISLSSIDWSLSDAAISLDVNKAIVDAEPDFIRSCLARLGEIEL